MKSLDLVVVNRSGLHARAAATFVRTATRFRSAIFVANASARGPQVNGKSLTSLLTASVARGQRIRLSAEGDDETEALEALRAAVESGLGEDAAAADARAADARVEDGADSGSAR